jgi:ribosomal protein S18 acetylase RimI-like enzyme
MTSFVAATSFIASCMYRHCVQPEFSGVAFSAGSQLLAASLACCEEDPAIKRVMLHVHTANTEALEFYSRKGFTVSWLLQHVL